VWFGLCVCDWGEGEWDRKVKRIFVYLSWCEMLVYAWMNPCMCAPKFRERSVCVCVCVCVCVMMVVILLVARMRAYILKDVCMCSHY
jgi:hypothetical protein